MHRTSWVALVAAMGAFAPAYAYAQTATPRVELQLGNGENASISGGVFVPFVLPSGQVLFGDAWLDYQDGNIISGSVGLGMRQQVDDWVVGVNGALDFASSAYGFSYQQVSAGIEALGTQFEFRLNGHAPIGDAANRVDGLSTASLRNGSFVGNQGYEVALYGVDAEAGIRLPVFDQDSPNALKLFGGAFVEGSHFTETVTGLTLRTELTLGLDEYIPGATVALGGGLRYDSTETLSGSAYIRFSAPIGGPQGQPQTAASPLFQRVERSRNIATTAGAFGADEAVMGASGSSRVLQVSAADGATSDLKAMIASAGSGAIILATGDIVLDQTLVLASNQTLVGGGGVVDLQSTDGRNFRYVNSGAKTTLAAAGAGPTLFAALAAPTTIDGIRLADGSTVSTLSILGVENGIVAEGVNNVTIDNVSIGDVSGNGIVLTSVKGAAITNSSVSNTAVCVSNTLCEFAYGNPQFVPNAGIKALGVTDLTVRDTTLTDVEYGIFIGSLLDRVDYENVMREQSRNIDIKDVTITNSRREGVLMVSSDNIRIDGLIIDNGALERSMDLIVFQRTGNSSLTNTTLIGGSNNLMFVNASGLPGLTGNIDISDVNLYDPNRANIFVNGGVTDVRFNNVMASGAGTNGLYLYSDSWGFMGGSITDLTFDNVTIAGARDSGVYLSGPLEKFDGNIEVINSRDCTGYFGDWSGTEILPDSGQSFSLNGTELRTETLAARCI